MNIDQILREVLANPELKEKYWPEITNPDAQNVNTLLMHRNIYLTYLHSVFSDRPDTARKQAISNLLN